MPTVTSTWGWTVDALGMADAGHSSTITWTPWLSSDGSPSNGCVQATCITKNVNTYEDLVQPTTGYTWEALGVPAGAKVTNFQVSAWNFKKAAATNLTSHSITITFIADDGTEITTTPSVNAVSLGTGTSAWGAGSAGTTQPVLAAYQPSNTDTRLRLRYAVVTPSGGSTPSIDTRFDDVTVTITYEFKLAAGTGTFAETGQAATLLKGSRLSAAAGTFAETGRAASLLVGHRLTASAGSFAETGRAASLLKGSRLVAAAGPFSLTGNPAGLVSTRILTAAAGAFALAGQGAGLIATRVLAAGVGAFAISGLDAGLAGSFVLAAVPGGFDLAGIAADLIYTQAGHYTLAADAGTFDLSGEDAGLLADRRLTAGAGAFAESTIDAGLLVGHRLTAGAGAFALAGGDASLIATRVLAASAGTFAVAGEDAGLPWGHVLAADAGAFALTGNPASLVYTQSGHYTLAASPGIFDLAGRDSALLASRVLATSPGTFAETGQLAGLSVDRRLPAAPGSFVVSTAGAGLRKDSRLLADAGSLILTAGAANLTVTGSAPASYTLSAGTGHFGLAGVPAGYALTPSPACAARPDMLRSGIAWLNTRLAAHAGEPVTYLRGVEEVEVTATFGPKLLKLSDGAGGFRIQRTDMDFLIPASELVFGGTATTPRRGDLIRVANETSTEWYVVYPVSDREAEWRYSDPFQYRLRVHTKHLRSDAPLLMAAAPSANQQVFRWGLSWLNEQFRDYASECAIYRRGPDSASVLATFGKKLLHVSDGAGGFMIEHTDMDFLIPAEQIVLGGVATTPARGDFVDVRTATTLESFRVTPYGDEPEWRWADPYQYRVRVHTKHATSLPLVA